LQLDWHFYSASVNYGSSDICLSVRPSVCLSVTFQCSVQTNENMILRSYSFRYRTIILVSGEVNFIRIFAGDHPSEALKVRLAKIWPILHCYIVNKLVDYQNEHLDLVVRCSISKTYVLYSVRRAARSFLY